MKLKKPGKNISKAEIQNISEFGIWMLVEGEELFLSYEDFPWFKKATIEQIYNFEFLHGEHLYWKDLDVDLSLEIIRAPKNFPQLAK